MPIARAELVDSERAGLYHCISRCVRRAFLCGGRDGKYDHRRDWLEARLRELAGLFAIDVVAYAIMSNHVHVLLWTDPRRVEGWDDLEVARRWLALFPGPAWDNTDPEDQARLIAADPERVEELRNRLSSLSWFNRCLKEPLSRIANAEDGCSGVFWEGRFKSYRVADTSGALTCAVYIDLNVIRAGMATTPESSRHTSVRERIGTRQRSSKAGVPRGKRRRVRRGSTGGRHEEDSLWLTPLSHEGARRTGRRSLCNIGVDTYVKIVDAVGRRIRSKKRGSIPKALRPILDRLNEDTESWVRGLRRQLDELWGTTIAQEPASLAAEAVRRDRRWVVNPLRPPG